MLKSIAMPYILSCTNVDGVSFEESHSILEQSHSRPTGTEGLKGKNNSAPTHLPILVFPSTSGTLLRFRVKCVDNSSIKIPGHHPKLPCNKALRLCWIRAYGCTHDNNKDNQESYISLIAKLCISVRGEKLSLGRILCFFFFFTCI